MPLHSRLKLLGRDLTFIKSMLPYLMRFFRFGVMLHVRLVFRKLVLVDSCKLDFVRRVLGNKYFKHETWRCQDCNQKSLFPTCQVRVVRFYVSTGPPPPRRPPPPPSPRPPPPAVVLLNCDPVSSVWRAGPQPRSCEFSVACWTPTAILRVQCGVPDPNRDPANSVWRPGPQPRSCEFSVASRTPTAIL